MTKEFLPKEDHFNELVAKLDPSTSKVYKSMNHTRAESCFTGRTLIIFEVIGRNPRIIDEIEVLDFDLNDDEGASTLLRSKTTGDKVEIGYVPTQLFNHPVIAFLPLYSRTRWCATEDNVGKGGSLAFDLVLKTMSRKHLREKGVIYCETGTSFSAEFQGADTKATA